MKVLTIDIGGTNVKILASGQGDTEPRRFPSGPQLTPGKMVSHVKKLAADWQYDVVSIGYPGPVDRGRPTADPHNLGKGWVRFNYAHALMLSGQREKAKEIYLATDAPSAEAAQKRRSQILKDFADMKKRRIGDSLMAEVSARLNE